MHIPARSAGDRREARVARLVGIVLVALSAAGFGTLALFGRYAYAGLVALPLYLYPIIIAILSYLALLAAICLSETLSPLAWIGGGLILTAVLMQTRGESRCSQPVLMHESNHD